MSNEYDEKMIVVVKNLESVFANMNHFEQKRVEAATLVQSLISTIADLTSQVESLNQKMATTQAKLYEAGIR